MCPAGMPLPMLLQTCRHNFLDRIEVRMGAVKAHTLKEIIEQAELAEKSAKKFKPSVSKIKWRVNTKGRDTAQSSQSKGKETTNVELSGTAQLNQKNNTNGNQEFKFPPKVYSFKDEQVATIFHCCTRVTNSSYLKLDDLMKWGVQMILTTVSFIPANAISLRTRSKHWRMLEF